jgi:hypothetical protein
MYSEFFDDKPVSRLIGEGIDGSHINDDAGVCDLYQQIDKRSLTTSNSPANSLI